MAMLRRWILVWLALFFSASSLVAASGEENRDFRAATDSLALGAWERAERELTEFLANYPASEHLPNALLNLAQAQFKQRKFSELIALLTASQSKAGGLADQYLYWLAEAHFQNTNFTAAAENFGKLARDFTNSSVRLEASVGEAASLARLKQWTRVSELLKKPDGAFRQSAVTNPDSELAARGWLLLAEAELMQSRYAEAETALASPTPASLKPELAWRKQYLLCQTQFASGQTNEALAGTTNLLVLAEGSARRDLLPETISFRAGLLEQLGRLDDAKAAYALNLTTNAPPERQRQALAKIAELALAQNRLEESIQRVGQFLVQFSNSPAADMALLTLGELFLKQSASLVPQALTNFDRLIATFPESSLVGKAQLNRGWCFWVSTNLAASAEAFKTAVDRLPLSEDLAVARFKLADTMFAQTNFVGALENYRLADQLATNWPYVKETLTAQSLYQVLRCGRELKDIVVASNAMKRILLTYPNSPLADRSVLLVGQQFVDLNQPNQAQTLFEEFLEKFPDSELRAEVELAVARTIEQKPDWSGAIVRYEAWLEHYATNRLRPQAEFLRAQAHFHAGNESNAFVMFTNFVAQFQTSELAPKAQWWIADYYYRRDEFLPAEISFKLLFQNWPASALADEARMMAGRAAFDRKDYPAAIEHFTSLTSDTNRPVRLRTQALFAYGGALMLQNPGETNKTANFELAIRVFNTIRQDNPATESAARAWGEMGKCYLQLAALDPRHYESASNAFHQVISSPQAGFALRSQAIVGLGKLAEGQAAQKVGADRIAGLKQALNHYLDAFLYEKILRDGEQPNWFWVKNAGLEAGRVAESLEEWAQAMNIYQSLQKLLPPLQASLEKRIIRAQERLASGK